MKRIGSGAMIFFGAIILAGCQTDRDVGSLIDQDGDSNEVDNVILYNVEPEEAFQETLEDLRDKEVEVTDDGSFQQTVFPLAMARTVSVGGEEVRIFVYETQTAAETDARLITPEGDMVEDRDVIWAGNPHFFYEDQVIALYMGTDKAVLEALTDVFGEQIAGEVWEDDDGLLDDANDATTTDPETESSPDGDITY